MFCVGSVGAGKTLLLKRLECREEAENEEELIRSLQIETIPTVGVNHFEIFVEDADLKDKKKKAKPKKAQVKELGGALAQNWCLYLKQVSARRTLIYVVDLSNPAAVAEVAVHLVDCLELLKGGSSVLVVYSKVDLVEEVETQLIKFRSLLRLPHIRDHYKNIAFSEVTYSLYGGQGVPYIRDFIKRLCN